MEQNQTGLLLKRKPEFIRWDAASLREAGYDSEGYYLKVDGGEQNGEPEQLYLMLNSMDVVQVIEQWKKIIETGNDNYAKYLLKQVMKGENQ